MHTGRNREPGCRVFHPSEAALVVKYVPSILTSGSLGLYRSRLVCKEILSDSRGSHAGAACVDDCSPFSGAEGVLVRFARDERGQMLILAALATMVLCGLLALSVDVGLLFRVKRNMQIAADAAATSGALDFYYNSSITSATVAAQAASAANGVTNGSGGAVVTVNTPPADGPNRGTNGFIEVVVSQPNPTVFMKIFSFGSMTVAARAVAGTPGASQGCVYILNPTSSLAMELQGSFDVSASHCGVIVDSNASDALQFTGSGGSLTAGSVSVVGGDGGQTGDSTPTPVVGAAPANDPISISGPVPPGGCTVPAQLPR